MGPGGTLCTWRLTSSIVFQVPRLRSDINPVRLGVETPASRRRLDPIPRFRPLWKRRIRSCAYCERMSTSRHSSSPTWFPVSSAISHRGSLFAGFTLRLPRVQHEVSPDPSLPQDWWQLPDVRRRCNRGRRLPPRRNYAPGRLSHDDRNYTVRKAEFPASRRPQTVFITPRISHVVRRDIPPRTPCEECPLPPPEIDGDNALHTQLQFVDPDARMEGASKLKTPSNCGTQPRQGTPVVHLRWEDFSHHNYTPLFLPP